jgi:hypothetical protein
MGTYILTMLKNILIICVYIYIVVCIVKYIVYMVRMKLSNVVF